MNYSDCFLRFLALPKWELYSYWLPTSDSILPFNKLNTLPIEFNKATSDYKDPIILQNFKSDLKFIHILFIQGSELKFYSYLVKRRDIITV